MRGSREVTRWFCFKPSRVTESCWVCATHSWRRLIHDVRSILPRVRGKNFQRNRSSKLEPSGSEAQTLPLGHSGPISVNLHGFDLSLRNPKKTFFDLHQFVSDKSKHKNFAGAIWYAVFNQNFDIYRCWDIQ
ncbi:hypothetical protein AVEN_1864-1 [Araneus ventricosus]|uniref:Uncharacterized protein n=1 Tax=Araneus ventricosus TaxID=182803 RepID=A0A4Y2SR49_ARAVE|nr:hypothetical protein AVEN_1864-1 [Araneus ventricosus]